jgi:hypothetical protein
MLATCSWKAAEILAFLAAHQMNYLMLTLAAKPVAVASVASLLRIFSR